MQTFRRPLATLTLAGAVAMATVGTVTSRADEGEAGVYVTQQAAPVDYRFQGEYTGKAGEELIRYGAQVIALGNDKFRLVGYAGGLPGDGWDPATEKIEVDGERVGDEVVFKNDLFVVRVTKEGTMIPASASDGVNRGELNRVVRHSDTLGKKAPEGALVLFDGTSADAFENGKIVQDDLLLADCESKETFGDHVLHLEFRTPFKPEGRGQGRGNSGVYVQGRYEIQVLDSFGLSGENNECGGIYQIAKPRVNMCFPPLQWQSYDIEFTAAKYDDQGEKTANARVRVLHNGVVIHEDLELPHATPGKYPEGPEPGPLYLQGHGNPVVYRNIWVQKK
jgi:hypothetical protein